MRHAEFYPEWLGANGREFTLHGQRFRLRAHAFEAIYPYRYRAMQCSAEPIGQTAPHYRETARRVGSDWLICPLDMDFDPDTESGRDFLSICEQLGIWQD